MTNEEKARELLEEWEDCELIDIEECRKRTCCNLCQTERVLILMAKWKDEQHENENLLLLEKTSQAEVRDSIIREQKDEILRLKAQISKSKKEFDQQHEQSLIDLNCKLEEQQANYEELKKRYDEAFERERIATKIINEYKKAADFYKLKEI